MFCLQRARELWTLKTVKLKQGTIELELAEEANFPNDLDSIFYSWLVLLLKLANTNKVTRQKDDLQAS